jgi:hypothetical protein
MPQLDLAEFVSFVVPSIDAPVSLANGGALDRRGEFGNGFKPPSGRALLTSYCTLLL